MLEANTGNAGAAGIFEHFLSTDTVKVFKPHPRAYHVAERFSGCRGGTSRLQLLAGGMQRA